MLSTLVEGIFFFDKISLLVIHKGAIILIFMLKAQENQIFLEISIKLVSIGTDSSPFNKK